MTSFGDMGPEIPAQRFAELLRSTAPRGTPMAGEKIGTAARNIRPRTPVPPASLGAAFLKLLSSEGRGALLECFADTLHVPRGFPASSPRASLAGLPSPPGLPSPRPLFSCSSSRGPWSLVSCQVNRNSVDSYSADSPLSKKMGKAYAKVRQHIGRRPLPLSPTPAMSAEMPELRSSPVWRRTSGINSPLGRSRADVHLMRTPMISDARRRSLRSE